MLETIFCRPLNLRRFSGPVRVWFVLALGALLVSGCATRSEIVGLQDDARRIRIDIDSVKQAQAQMAVSMTAMESEIRDLSAKSEYGSSSLQEKVESLTARLDEILGRMDRTIAPLEEFMRKQQETDTSSHAALGTDLYDAAQKDLAMGNYDLAEDSYLQFLQQNPKSDLADDARYGLAETYYARKKYSQAADEYQRVVDMSPMGPKASAAMLKLGLCQKATGDVREARRTWEDLIKAFPRSDEAKLAQERLRELKK